MKDDLARQRVTCVSKLSNIASYGWFLTALMMIVVYYGLFCVAFGKGFMSQTHWRQRNDYALPIGLFVLLFTIVITGIYVRRANTEFDELNEQVRAEIQKTKPIFNRLIIGLLRVMWLWLLAAIWVGRKQATNWTAIFHVHWFVILDHVHYQMGGWSYQISSRLLHRRWRYYRLPNGLAIAGDHMSAASFLGISAAVMNTGFDGLIYSIGFWSVGQ